MSADSERNKWLYTHQNKILTLEEIFHISSSYYGGENLFSLFNMLPKDFYAKGLRILGRTAIECCIDLHAIKMAEALNKIVFSFFPNERPIVMDLFTGSGNLLYHFSKKLNAIQTIGFEKDQTIYNLTQDNMKEIDFECDFYHEDALIGLEKVEYVDKAPIVVVIAPPWGKAFNHINGLNLLETDPPIHDIISHVNHYLKNRRILFVIQAHENTCQNSMNIVTAPFLFHQFSVINSIKPGLNVGLLICTHQKKVNVHDNS